MAKSIMQGSGARGTKTLVSTGLDTSSYGSRGTESLGGKAKGSVATCRTASAAARFLRANRVKAFC